jgi:diguanylate cyclase (GGDEF)-like protein
MRRYHDIRELAIRDNLTGLYNTRYLYEALGELYSTRESTGGCFSLIFLDIDDFKHVVDTYGHLLGSQALREVGETIRSCLVRPAFGVAYGGDEFVAVLPDFEKKQALEKAKEIGSEMGRTEYLSDFGHPVHLSASFGVATFPDDGTDLRSLLGLADEAMFQVKEKGKGAVLSA